MTLIPRSVIDTKKNTQNINSRKKYVLNFLDTSLDENQIAYFTYCINRLNAFRSINAQNYKSKEEPIINRRGIETEEIDYTEREIKCFIILQNASLFSPIEYKDLYDKYIAQEKELKQVV